ncbi:MAG: hypothetical protein JO254_15540 [Pseudolabrys sp.]|nr:hypothetical protein [Pseudolabrys sp.]
MRKITTFSFAVVAVMFVAVVTASAAPLSPAAICKAAGKKTSLVSKIHCRVVRRCGYFGCSYEEVCS